MDKTQRAAQHLRELALSEFNGNVIECCTILNDNIETCFLNVKKGNRHFVIGTVSRLAIIMPVATL